VRGKNHRTIVSAMEIDIAEALGHPKTALDSGRQAFGLWKDIKGSKPTPEQEAQIESLFQDAENERQLALASIGQAFGYTLCRCTLPPQVCLRIGYDEYSGAEKSKCPGCREEYPVKVKPLPKQPSRTFTVPRE